MAARLGMPLTVLQPNTLFIYMHQTCVDLSWAALGAAQRSQMCSAEAAAHQIQYHAFGDEHQAAARVTDCTAHFSDAQ